MAEDAISGQADRPGRAERLWTPWRMRYVVGGVREDGCIFCNRLAEQNDVATLILYRGEHAFIIMNLYPYNTGHVMIVPNAHISSPEDATAETLQEMTDLRTQALRALRRALSPTGFNLGMNVGAVAGAGVADHLHEHVVPRWQGDANFMPILASTVVMPELLPATYAKLRAELHREMSGDAALSLLVFSPDYASVLVDAGRLPYVTAEPGESLAQAGVRASTALGANDPVLLAWGGDPQAGLGPIALLYTANLPVTAALPIAAARATLPPQEWAQVDRALRLLQAMP